MAAKMTLIFGIESGVQRVLDQAIHKKLALPVVESALAKSRKIGVDRQDQFRKDKKDLKTNCRTIGDACFVSG
jgi:hypothetical protein